jgi:adenylate cyclase
MGLVNLQKQLRYEILLSERLKAILLAVVSAVTIVILTLVSLIFRSDLKKFFVYSEFTYIIIAIFLFFMVREVIVINYINRKLKNGEDVSDRVRYITNFIEISLPSVILITIGFVLETTDVLVSPVIFFYFIFIILSTLSLEFKISVSIGIIAAVEYLLVFLILSESFDNASENIVFNSLLFHIGKANILIVGGIISGFVAEQIKKKMVRVHKTLVERNKIINMFGQQISSSIVDHLLETGDEIKGERKYVCVMFLDIRGFSIFAADKQPEEIIKFQNDVFGFMIEIIAKNSGIINQFLGDGYMATFGAPIGSDNDCQNALNASVEIIDELEKKNENGELPGIKIGIGLHSGYVVAGNVGTETRKQYSISGNTVILASRIEQLNKTYGSRLLISKEVKEKVELKDLKTEYHGKVQIKGRAESIEIYQIK